MGFARPWKLWVCTGSVRKVAVDGLSQCSCVLRGFASALELITDESKAGACLWITKRRGFEYWPSPEEENKYIVRSLKSKKSSTYVPPDSPLIAGKLNDPGGRDRMLVEPYGEVGVILLFSRSLIDVEYEDMISIQPITICKTNFDTRKPYQLQKWILSLKFAEPRSNLICRDFFLVSASPLEGKPYLVGVDEEDTQLTELLAGRLQAFSRSNDEEDEVQP
ncbi:hypothetical protein KSP40_PGU008643 [Platanthera guangdongensis]|uniref:Uncharacterized protein n=1 Tax=Platanthera guangdongensis TaxID=2320717 RepID=A0ABR2LIZ4_9ASPA